MWKWVVQRRGAEEKRKTTDITQSPIPGEEPVFELLNCVVVFGFVSQERFALEYKFLNSLDAIRTERIQKRLTHCERRRGAPGQTC